jgi:hypothetical protein
MTEKLLDYQIIRQVGGGGTQTHVALQTHTNTIVTIRRFKASEAMRKNIKLLMRIVQSHPLNSSPYTVRTLECLYDGEHLSIVQEYMDLGLLASLLEKNDLTLTDDFILYVFMQVVYAMKMHRAEQGFCRSIGMEHIWLNALGKVQICWASILLSNESLLDEWIQRYQQYYDCSSHAQDIKKLRTQTSSPELMNLMELSSLLESAGQGSHLCDRKTDGAPAPRNAPARDNAVHPASSTNARGGKDPDGEEPILLMKYENLGLLFFRLLFRCEGRRRMRELKEVLSKGATLISFMNTAVSNTLYEFSSILYRDGSTSDDVERYIKKIIQNRTISSNPQAIFRVVDPFRNTALMGAVETREAETPAKDRRSLSTMSKENLKCTTTRKGRFLIEEFSETENSANSSEKGEKKSGDKRMWTLRTREYKRGRFHVCEAIPANESSKSTGSTQYTKKLLRIIDIQAQQINLLLKVLKKNTNMDRLVEEEFRGLAEQADSLMLGLDSSP